MGPFFDPVSAPAMWGSVLLLCFVLAVGVFDFIALQSNGRLMTISQVIQGWSSQYPLIPLLTGVVLGHLFFPTRIAGTPNPPLTAQGAATIAAGVSVNRVDDRQS